MTGRVAFSLDCELGVATSATQIEGGRADTIWHRWAATGAARDHSTPEVACDHWNRYETDADLLAELGIRHYRLGLEWARIEPEPGVFSAEALGHYRRELQALRERGVTPLVTLHHFNDPGWLSEAGGFLKTDAVAHFARYVRAVVDALGNLVTEWVTVNEPNVFAYYGYLLGTWPPGRRSYGDAMKVYTNLAHAHISAYRVIHEVQGARARVGFAMHLRGFSPRQPRNPLDRAAASSSEYLFQGVLLRALCRGRFLAPLKQPRGVRPGRYYDFLGLNYYTRGVVSGPNQLTASRVPVNDLGWEIHPAGLVELARRYSSLYPGPIYITENGTADAADAFRSRYVYEHLRAIAESGLPIERYYHWTLVDNWEWAEGQTARFGLVELDFESQERRVRESGRFYADVIANGGVTTAAYERWVAPQIYRTNA